LIVVADNVLTLVGIENLFQSITMRILGIPEKDINNVTINQDKVRISWPTSGAPSFKIGDDITFIQVLPTDDPIIQQRDVVHSAIENDNNNSNRTVVYTRNHLIQWVIYGPNSFENADNLRNGIYQPEITESLLLNNLALITTVPAPRRVPELFNGQWWERCDLQASFNEEVTRRGTIPNITQVIMGDEIIIQKG
jgi:hypothetical protein